MHSDQLLKLIISSSQSPRYPQGPHPLRACSYMGWREGCGLVDNAAVCGINRIISVSHVCELIHDRLSLTDYHE